MKKSHFFQFVLTAAPNRRFRWKIQGSIFWLIGPEFRNKLTVHNRHDIYQRFLYLLSKLIFSFDGIELIVLDSFDEVSRMKLSKGKLTVSKLTHFILTLAWAPASLSVLRNLLPNFTKLGNIFRFFSKKNVEFYGVFRHKRI